MQVPMLGSIAGVEIDWALGLVLARAKVLPMSEKQYVGAAAPASAPEYAGRSGLQDSAR